MCAKETNDNLSALLKTGYGAPPPREEFVRDLGERMRKELSEQHAAPAAPQPRRVSPIRWSWAAAAAAAVVLLITGGITWTLTHPGGGPQTSLSGGSISPPEPEGTPQEQMVPLEIKLPKPQFIGTNKNIPLAPTLEKYDIDKKRPPLMVPAGTMLLSKGKKVTSSDMEPIIGDLNLTTDGNKEGDEGSFVELGHGKQWVQIDLGEPAAIYALVIWHYHSEMRVYHDTVIQVADDADFIENVRTVYNNDYDNSSGLGVGKDLEYCEDYRGRLIDAKGVTGRYVRLYSNGNTSNDQNHYTEVEVYGKPAPAAPAKGPKGEAGVTGTTSTTSTPAEEMVPLETKLPKARGCSPARNIEMTPHMEKYSDKPRATFLVPKGTVNLALGKPVTSSDLDPIIGELKMVTDGNKEGDEGSFVELGFGNWIQIDLKEAHQLYAVLVWHYHSEMRVYHDVVVQASSDPGFAKDVQTLFNNDYDNSLGLGVGKNLEYIEDYRGRLIDAKGVIARYVRLYSRGSNSNEQNHYIEVEVYGKPAKAAPAATKSK